LSGAIRSGLSEKGRGVKKIEPTKKHVDIQSPR